MTEREQNRCNIHIVKRSQDESRWYLADGIEAGESCDLGCETFDSLDVNFVERRTWRSFWTIKFHQTNVQSVPIYELFKNNCPFSWCRYFWMHLKNRNWKGLSKVISRWLITINKKQIDNWLPFSTRNLIELIWSIHWNKTINWR